VPGFVIWRHPRPLGHEGRCIGARSDLGVDPRKAKRLAHRIRAAARREGRVRLVLSSPLRRCAAVGRWLRRWGWRHQVDAALREMDFGAWDGQRWEAIGAAALDAWLADFAHHAPGGGESLAALLERVRAWQAPVEGVSVVGHGGWMQARRWAMQHGAGLPQPPQWQGTPGYGERLDVAG
jgi:alpha-ribazole phosphatase